MTTEQVELALLKLLIQARLERFAKSLDAREYPHEMIMYANRLEERITLTRAICA